MEREGEKERDRALMCVCVCVSDVFVSDDGARNDVEGPYYSNTGLFFVRYSDKTRRLMQVRDSNQTTSEMKRGEKTVVSCV